MWVVKIGGSLMSAPELKYWLDIFVKFSDGQIIIVPGGGVFADAVREAQQLTGVSDAMAHQLAVKAMDQYGLLLTALNPKLAIASSELEIAERTWQHRAILWLPSQMVLADDDIPQNWAMSSDSLAAWLAHKLDAKQLVLLKSTKPQNGTLNKLIADGIVDGCFADFSKNQSFSSWILAKDDYVHFADGLNMDKLNQIGINIEA